MGNRPAKLNEKKSDRDLEQKISAGEKRRNANGHQGENERVKKSEQQQVQQRLPGSFTWLCKTTAKKCTKKVCCTCKDVFC